MRSQPDNAPKGAVLDPGEDDRFGYEERYRLLVDAVTDYAIFMLGPDGRVLTWNPGAERSIGYRSDEVLGRNFAMFLLPEDAAAGLPALELAEAERQGRFQTEAWRKRKNGERFWALVTLTAIRGGQGELRGFAKVTRDLTALKSSEEALRGRNADLERYRTIVENLEEYGVGTLDEKGRYVDWAGPADKHLGYKSEEVLYRDYDLLATEEDRSAGLPQKELQVAADTGRSARDCWKRRKDGSLFWASGTLHALRDQAGKLTGYVRVGRDMTEQKKTSENLRELNAQLQRYRTMIENIDAYAIYTLDTEGRITSWEAGAQKITGTSAAEMIGRHYSTFFTPEDVAAGLPQRDLNEAARTGRYIADAWRIAPDGQRVWSSGVLNALRNEQGELTGFVRTARIMTEQKLSEDALRELNAQLERYRNIVENVDEYSMYTLDAEGRLTSWEAGAQRLSGTPTEEMLGRHYSSFFTPEDVLAGVPEHDLAEAARTGRYVSDAWRITPKGERVWSSGVLSALRDPQGKLTGYLRIARMMTEQKKADDALRELNARLHLYQVIVENISEHYIFTLDAQGRFQSWSPAAETALGYSFQQVRDREHSLLFPPEDVAAGMPHRELEEAERTGRCATESWRVRLNGERFWCSGVTTAIRDEAGQVTGFVRVARDMTRQKRLEESLARQAAELARQAADLEQRVAERTQQLELTVEELRRKNEEVEAMAAITARDLEDKKVMLNEIHHRVKNNLQVVQSLLKLSVRALPPGEARTVTMTTAQRVHAMAIVHERLYQTKDLAGISVLTYLNDLFAGVIESNSALLGQIELEVDCDDILLNLDHAIPFGLLVNELLTNCLKHAFPNGRMGTVNISVRLAPGGVLLRFKDDGIGLPDGFNPAKCTSMGLKLAASLAHQLGGALKFTSDHGCLVEATLTRVQNVGG